MAPAGNKAKWLSSVNHTTKTVHHHHHRHRHHGGSQKLGGVLTFLTFSSNQFYNK